MPRGQYDRKKAKRRKNKERKEAAAAETVNQSQPQKRRGRKPAPAPTIETTAPIAENRHVNGNSIGEKAQAIIAEQQKAFNKNDSEYLRGLLHAELKSLSDREKQIKNILHTIED